jgi:5-methyltetrahydropteroyltriglutamate--homocysteine methyltransferase
MRTYAYGFPRLGANREYKKAIESFWRNEIGEDEVREILSGIQRENIMRYRNSVDLSPDGEMSFYDPMLDTAVLCGIYDPKNLKEYYSLCRGPAALGMTKWFNTNYHYLVPDFSKLQVISFRSNLKNPALEFKKCGFPQFIGPFTFLKLSKGIGKADFRDVFLSLSRIYRDIAADYERLQLDEPAFVMDLRSDEVDLIKEGYSLLGRAGCKITLMTYYDSVDFMADLLTLPVAAIGLDLLRGRENFDYISANGFPADKALIAGLVDGRNVWRCDCAAQSVKARALAGTVPGLMVSNAAPLYHLPVSLSGEKQMDINLKKCLAFAEEKLFEIRTIDEYFGMGEKLPESRASLDYGRDEAVRERVKSLRPGDFIKGTALEERRGKQDSLLNLPLFPATTIGSFPQTSQIRLARASYLKGELPEEKYRRYLYGEIDKLVNFQEKLGLDVLVHGEFERTDMVEFFAQRLNGIAATGRGWVISYGTRAYRPPVIFGDVSRPGPMTVEEVRYAQLKTDKPVKGMLTGAVTLIAWSYCREDIPLKDTAYQIALCLRDEIIDYEKAGIKIVQVDEPAFREKAPIKKRDWVGYFDWAVRSFNLATNTDPRTQIHTHMCYSEFGEIMEYINLMDYDVISIEASRSKGDIIESFEKIDFRRQVGLGVWDVHSPNVPSVEEMLDIVKRALKKIPKENFWLNPDCGLKTRDWPETKKSLENLLKAAGQLRSGS